MEKILVIDDDTGLCKLLEEYLGADGFLVAAVNNGEEGLRQMLLNSYSLVILDITLPTMDGFKVMSGIREKWRVPVLMLTARGDEMDRIIGLEMGADDYLPKPFNPRELLARIRSVLRRTRQGQADADGALVVIDDLELDAGSRTVRCKGAPLALTSAEFAILEILVRSAGNVVSKEDLAVKVLGHSLMPFDRSIDVHISRLRKKLGLGGHGTERIVTVRAAGYIYTLPPTALT